MCLYILTVHSMKYAPLGFCLNEVVRKGAFIHMYTCICILPGPTLVHEDVWDYIKNRLYNVDYFLKIVPNVSKLSDVSMLHLLILYSDIACSK